MTATSSGRRELRVFTNSFSGRYSKSEQRKLGRVDKFLVLIEDVLRDVLGFLMRVSHASTLVHRRGVSSGPQRAELCPSHERKGVK